MRRRVMLMVAAGALMCAAGCGSEGGALKVKWKRSSADESIRDELAWWSLYLFCMPEEVCAEDSFEASGPTRTLPTMVAAPEGVFWGRVSFWMAAPSSADGQWTECLYGAGDVAIADGGTTVLVLGEDEDIFCDSYSAACPHGACP